MSNYERRLEKLEQQTRIASPRDAFAVLTYDEAGDLDGIEIDRSFFPRLPNEDRAALLDRATIEYGFATWEGWQEIEGCYSLLPHGYSEPDLSQLSRLTDDQKALMMEATRVMLNMDPRYNPVRIPGESKDEMVKRAIEQARKAPGRARIGDAP